MGFMFPVTKTEAHALYRAFVANVPDNHLDVELRLAAGHRYQLLLGEGCKLYVRASGERLTFRVSGYDQDGADVAKCRHAAARLAGGVVSVTSHFAEYLRAIGQSVAPTEFGGLDWIVYGGKAQDRITSAYYAKHPELL